MRFALVEYDTGQHEAYDVTDRRHLHSAQACCDRAYFRHVATDKEEQPEASVASLLAGIFILFLVAILVMAVLMLLPALQPSSPLPPPALLPEGAK